MNPKFVTCTVIEADKPTINGRIYPRAVLEKAVEEYNRLGTSFVMPELNGTRVSLNKVIATSNDFKLTDDGKIVATIQFIDPLPEEAAELLLKMCDFSPMSMGTVNDAGEIQDDLKFAYFALTPKEKDEPQP